MDRSVLTIWTNTATTQPTLKREIYLYTRHMKDPYLSSQNFEKALCVIYWDTLIKPGGADLCLVH